jgi:type IV pilus assembly protein PilB
MMSDTILATPAAPSNQVPARHKKRLGELLIEAGLVTQTQVSLALREQKKRGGLIGQILVELGFVQPEIIADYVAREAEAKVVNISRAIIDKAVLQLVPFDMARRFRALPLSRENGTLVVALADPLDVVAIDGLQQFTGLNIDVVAAPERDILNCLDLHYCVGGTIDESIDRILEEQTDDSMSARALLEVEDLKVEDAPVIRLVDQIIARAVQNRASDIHFEPEQKSMRIRTRIDGLLYQDILVPKSMQSPVCARLKIMSTLDVAEQRIPQDGRASVLVGRREIHLRVSCLPTAHGENVVVRILDPSAQTVTLGGLGLAPEDEKAFRSAIKRPYGVVLVTGPTGSGKTTTLYAVLKEVASMQVSTFTLEDPIEYRMPLIRQTQVQEDIGLTFSSGLRALLRQDPDIILVGETRDTETAQLMVRAALTGHLVFSTLHTNDAAGAIPRLVDMGVEPFLLPSSLVAILAQRLVRTICPNCKEEVKNPEQVFDELSIEPPAGAKLQLWQGAGCSDCKNSGYKGRRGIFELMMIDERFHEPIVHRAGAPEYLRLARERGMRTMFEDGLNKVLKGLTTLQELLDATRLVEK